MLVFSQVAPTSLPHLRPALLCMGTDLVSTDPMPASSCPKSPIGSMAEGLRGGGREKQGISPTSDHSFNAVLYLHGGSGLAFLTSSFPGHSFHGAVAGSLRRCPQLLVALCLPFPPSSCNCPYLGTSVPCLVCHRHYFIAYFGKQKQTQSLSFLLSGH